jgi:DNA-binding transcriptional MerR regulator
MDEHRSSAENSMVRKRSAYTRQRAKRTRPKTPAPKTGWLMAELARLSQLPRRRIRFYLEHRLIEPSEFRGTATRYQRRELLRVLGIARLRAETGANLAEIKRKLDGLGDRDLEAWLRTQPLPLEAAAALGFPISRAHSEPSAHAPDAAVSTLKGQAGVAQTGSTWQRVCLLPGLELMLAADASPAVMRAARRICEEYVRPAELAKTAPS